MLILIQRKKIFSLIWGYSGCCNVDSSQYKYFLIWFESSQENLNLVHTNISSKNSYLGRHKTMNLHTNTITISLHRFFRGFQICYSACRQKIPLLLCQSSYSNVSTNKSLQYHNPDHQRLGFLFDYRELFQDIVILIIKDLLYLALVGRFWNW